MVDVRRAVAKRAGKEMAKQVVVNEAMALVATAQAVTALVETGPAAATAGARVGLVAEMVA